MKTFDSNYVHKLIKDDGKESFAVLKYNCVRLYKYRTVSEGVLYPIISRFIYPSWVGGTLLLLDDNGHRRIYSRAYFTILHLKP